MKKLLDPRHTVSSNSGPVSLGLSAICAQASGEGRGKDGEAEMVEENSQGERLMVQKPEERTDFCKPAPMAPAFHRQDSILVLKIMC